jgi:two-component sensor histidine kinase
LLVRDEMLLHAARPEQFAISGSEVRLPSKSAEWMSLVIHELAINAVEHGALGQSPARIEVAWQVEMKLGERFLHFEWLETGVRMPASTPFTPGFGCKLVERLIASELNGRGNMTFLAGGARCRIEIPLREPQPIP